ncbi:uncharacterized protein LOC123311811 [Coccinella septempunctata]|uniref:uncharacterized protein LOC123311811 n=1 Tax=Coccinella septempunctata TaxID=41139 RepID=UPI001D06C7AC|nr:uncharacterized protein LOC123311811 [Coccinella septempunctata]
MVPRWQELTPAQKSSKGNKIQNRWRNLKTCFRRELNKQKGSSGQAASKRKKYVYFDQLLFLLPTMEDRATVSECTSIEEDYSGSDDESQVIQVEDQSQNNEIKLSQPGPSTQNPQPINPTTNSTPSKHLTTPLGTSTRNRQLMTPKRTIPLKKKTETYEESLLAILKEKKAEPIDEDQSFLLSLVPSFKKLNDAQKLDAKMEFLSTLKRLTQTNETSYYQTSQGYRNHHSYGYPAYSGNLVSPANLFRTYNIENYQSHSSTSTPALSEISQRSSASSCDNLTSMEVPDFT